MKTAIVIDQNKIQSFCQKWCVEELSLFGSVLRDDYSYDSDVDVLVRLPEQTDLSLFDWLDMIDELKTIFGREIDLVDGDAIRNPFRRCDIFSSREVIYAKAEK